MTINEIKEFNNIPFVKAFAVPKSEARWRIYNFDVLDDMSDLKYYDELGKILGVSKDKMVRVPQNHSTSIRVVTEDVAGEGVIRPEIDGGCDGMITNAKGIVLLTVEADCTPVYIVDKKNKAIAMIHSGWRGTVGKITENAIRLMKENYGSDISDLIIHFGPSICGNCYEVGDDLIPEFRNILNDDEINSVFKRIDDKIIDGHYKYYLDVSYAIELSLLKMGIKEEQMSREEVCTFHDDMYDSWRLSHDKTKQMLTGIMIL